MATRLYVGNLPFSTTNEELRELFSSYGTVTDVHVVTDRETGRPRGFAFVSLETPEMAQAAVEGMNERRIGGRPLVVNQARERGEAPPRRPSGGPSGPPRPPSRPRPAAPPPASAVPLAPGEEGAKEIRRRPKKRKGKAAEGRGERAAQSRHQLLEEREVSRGTGGNWRQWLDDDEADLTDIKAPWEEIELEEEETSGTDAAEEAVAPDDASEVDSADEPTRE
ncbi:MAG: RNA-binding protein [Acidobacteriota bacterium]|nr:RNA-binding protein [Acidobacteriota bacterium]MDQ7087319.1 RNA-binding protein [Acidobacteriota bacterium]